MSSPVSSCMELRRRIDPMSLKDELERIFPQHTVTYSVMTDSFRIRHPQFSHKLEYNIHKSSRLESRSLVIKRFALYVNLVLLAVILVVVMLDQRLGWDLIRRQLLSSDMYFIGLILLLGVVQYLIPVLRPALRRDLETEHVKVRQTLEVLLM